MSNEINDNPAESAERPSQVVDIRDYLPFSTRNSHRSLPARRDPSQILLVDDAAFFRNMLGPVLVAAGYELTMAASAEEALELLETGRHFDVVITDIDMPDMTGFELADAVKSHPDHALVPIIALSLASPEIKERGGFDGYVAKFDRPGLLAAVKETGVAA